VTNVSETEYNPEDTGPVGGRRRELPAVPPARPRTPATGVQPAYHPTTEIDLSKGFPPVSNETSEIDLSGGWPQHLKVPPRLPSASRRSGRVMGVDVGTARVGLALSDPTGTLASPLETLRRAKSMSDIDRLAALVVEHVRPGREQLRSGTSRPHSGCAGNPDRRKAFHRDRSQSPA
jgi:putative Holliday junction resolvase